MFFAFLWGFLRGIVSIAGKTTLLNRIWGLQGRTGLFAHTEVPTLYQISDKIHIMDFPGDNFDHALTSRS